MVSSDGTKIVLYSYYHHRMLTYNIRVRDVTFYCCCYFVSPFAGTVYILQVIFVHLIGLQSVINIVSHTEERKQSDKQTEN
jgi:GTP cyclohydrolase I